MCGRYVSSEEAAIERFWKLNHAQRENPLGGRFNESPTATIPMLRLNETGGLEAVAARWELIPFWWKDEKPPKNTFNARPEEVGVYGSCARYKGHFLSEVRSQLHIGRVS